MNRKIWYLISCVIPFFLPLLFLHRNIDFPSDIWQMFKVIMVFQLLYTGAPYLVFCGVYLFWSIDKTATEIENAAWLLPVIFIPFAELGLFFIQQIGFNYDYRKDPNAVYMAFLFIIPLYGYFYLALIQFITWILHKTGALKD